MACSLQTKKVETRRTRRKKEDEEDEPLRHKDTKEAKKEDTEIQNERMLTGL